MVTIVSYITKRLIIPRTPRLYITRDMKRKLITIISSKKKKKTGIGNYKKKNDLLDLIGIAPLFLILQEKSTFRAH